MLIYMARDGKATQVRPIKQWNEMGYKPKEGVKPINLIGKGSKYIPYTPEEKAMVIQRYLNRKGVESVEELPKSAQYDLKERMLRGHPIPGTDYQYGYFAYDIMDVEPIEGAEIEKEPEEPSDNWWWYNKPADEKDIMLTTALIKFAMSNDCGNIKVNTDNTRAALGGARGNATYNGEINLINDGKMRFPTAVHELTHQLRHWAFASSNNPSLKKFYNRNADRDVREHEAELAAALVASSYDYDIQCSLNYLSSWKLDPETSVVVFDKISECANFIEYGIDKYLDEEEYYNITKNQ
jgi:hypothetical protein